MHSRQVDIELYEDALSALHTPCRSIQPRLTGLASYGLRIACAWSASRVDTYRPLRLIAWDHGEQYVLMLRSSNAVLCTGLR